MDVSIIMGWEKEKKKKEKESTIKSDSYSCFHTVSAIYYDHIVLYQFLLFIPYECTGKILNELTNQQQ